MQNRVGDHQLLAVGAKGAPFGEKLPKAGFVFFGIVGGAGVHNAKAEALNLLGQQALAVKHAVFVGVAGQIRRFCQRVNGVAHLAPQPFKVGLAGHAGVMLGNFAVGFKLRHAHILNAAAHRGNALAGYKHKQIAVKQLFGGYHLYRGQGIVVPRIVDLVGFDLPAGRHGGGKITNADAVHHIAAQKAQAGEHGASHIAQRKNVDACLALGGSRGEKLGETGVIQVDGAHLIGGDALSQKGVCFILRQCGAV